MSADTIINLYKIVEDLKARVIALETQMATLVPKTTKQVKPTLDKHELDECVMPFERQQNDVYRCHRFGMFNYEVQLVDYIITFAQARNFKLSPASSLFYVDVEHLTPSPTSTRKLHIVFSNNEFIDCVITYPIDGIRSVHECKITVFDCGSSSNDTQSL